MGRGRWTYTGNDIYSARKNQSKGRKYRSIIGRSLVAAGVRDIMEEMDSRLDVQSLNTNVVGVFDRVANYSSPSNAAQEPHAPADVDDVDGASYQGPLPSSINASASLESLDTGVSDILESIPEKKRYKVTLVNPRRVTPPPPPSFFYRQAKDVGPYRETVDIFYHLLSATKNLLVDNPPVTFYSLMQQSCLVFSIQKSTDGTTDGLSYTLGTDIYMRTNGALVSQGSALMQIAEDGIQKSWTNWKLSNDYCLYNWIIKAFNKPIARILVLANDTIMHRHDKECGLDWRHDVSHYLTGDHLYFPAGRMLHGKFPEAPTT